MEEFDELYPELVMGFREASERGRAGGQIMATDIEGHGRLAQIHRRMQQRDVESRTERDFLAAFYELRHLFDPSDEVFLKDKFLLLPKVEYKNVVCFLLAEYLNRQGLTKANLKATKQLANQLDRADISEEDILRYQRLITIRDDFFS